MNDANSPFVRRRLGFSLRLFFIAITAVCLWLGWNVYQVQRRKAVEKYVNDLTNNSALSYGQPRRPWKTLPVIWRFLGVRPVESIDLDGAYVTDEDRDHIQAAFPEAVIE